MQRINIAHFRKPLIALLCAFSLALGGCASGMRAIENRDLKVEAKMSDSIFLNAETLTSAPAIFVRVANTSDVQEIEFAGFIREKLQAMGYTITSQAKEAQYLVTANLLYMGDRKEGLDPDAIVRAGFGGAVVGGLVGAVAGANHRGSALAGAGAAALLAGAAMAGSEAIVGGIFHVDEFFGIVDLQVQEEVDGGVTGTSTANVQDGASTQTTLTRNLTQKRQEYRTRIVVNAKQTRMNRAEAVGVIADRLASQISGMFKI